MECPECHLINLPESFTCDCGYNFVTKKRKSEPKPALPDRIAEWKLEPELACPTPRRVVLRWDYIARVLFFAINSLFFLAAVLFFVWVGKADELLSALALWGSCGAFGVIMIFVSERKRRLSRLLVSRGTATRGTIAEAKWFCSGNRGN